jgi:DNA mismatch endonuclease, patch repair protein
MSLVRSKNSRPELKVRKAVFALGYRFRLHDRTLAGCPDLVFKKARRVIFVHGCFWHRHGRCSLARVPKSRVNFWLAKLESNRLRDVTNQRRLKAAGWKVLTIWECQLKSAALVNYRLRRFLDAKR